MAFSDYHPIVNFLFFTLVLGFSMFLMHPICLALSLCSAFCYTVKLNGRKALKFNLMYLLPLMLMTALLNPAFQHEGVTILRYLPSGNPLTLESIAYGFFSGGMLVAVILWFACYHKIMTSDKFIYLFGRVIPALSLILSMSLRFVPHFKAQMKVISNAQACIGRDASTGSIFRRAKYGIQLLSIMVTWVLESAIETADSMKSRGYGLPGRSAFSIFRWTRRDQCLLALFTVLGLYVLVGGWTGGLAWRYFPSMRGATASPYTLSLFVAYGVLCATPLLITALEDRVWRSIPSNT